ncbi:glycine oxidase ThiO [Bacillus spongiae]|uniref:glycine oxidase n=1 Tax=Bacillus spongiae TaxID=2683610 RepID=A0ABU8HJT8_9BACI
MRKMYEVLIVGGGIIGHSIAYSLSKRGISVLVLEKGQINEKSSSAAAGMLAVQAEMKKGGPLFELGRKSRNMFPALQAELKERTNIDIQLIQHGMLTVARTKEEKETIQGMIPFQKAAGEEVSWLSPDEVVEVEPSITRNTFGGMYAAKDGQVEAPKLSKAFAKAAYSLGTHVKEYTEVINLITDKGKCVGVETESERIYSDKVILTTGAWTKRLLQTTDFPLHVYPVKGECLSVTTKEPLLEKTVFTDGCYIVPKSSGRYIIGATMIPNTFDERVSVSGVSSLLDQAIALIPKLKNAHWEKVWSGIRPQTTDGKPYIGNHPSLKGLFVASGHYRNGILLSPITGEIMADIIEGKNIDQNVEALSLQRQLKEASGVEPTY